MVCARPHHALSARSMLVVPSAAELDGFGRPDLTLYNAGAFPANRRASHNASAASIALDLTRRELVVLGTLCPGDMRRGLQAALSHALPAAGAPCFHAACDEGGAGDAALLLGSEGRAALAGRGERRLLADGLVAWGEDGVCALEGGCHTVAGAWSGAGDGPGDGFGVLLEGAAAEGGGRVPGLASPSTTPRVRATYPTTLVPRNRMPCAARHPANLIMLCCDTLGVLPPVARLTADQAVYYFLRWAGARLAAVERERRCLPLLGSVICIGSSCCAVAGRPASAQPYRALFFDVFPPVPATFSAGTQPSPRRRRAMLSRRSPPSHPATALTFW